MRRAALLLLVLLALLASPPATAAESHPEVVVVVNASSPRSVAIGEHYARARGVPAENVARLPIRVRDATLETSLHETISREHFVTEVRDPLLRFLADKPGVRVLVVAKGVPLTVAGEGKVPFATYLRDQRMAALDAELALLGSGQDGAPGIVGLVNPYFDSDLSFEEFRARHPEAPLRYLVGRIDGYPEDVDDLVDRAQAPVPESGPRRWLVDEDPTAQPGRRGANVAMLRPAAGVLHALGQDVRHDATQAFVGDVANLAGYASWGSNDSHRPAPPFYGRIGTRTYPGTFLPRAIAIDLVSTNARTFARHAPIEKEQSLVAELIHLGVAGAAGHVREPFLGAVPRPYIVLRRYAEGVPAGEAYMRSVPYLGWMNLWIGDPLMSLPATAAAKPGPLAGDLDGDGVPNGEDDCLYLADRDQRDVDGDGIGSLCDPDVDQDGVVTTSWGRTDAPGDLERILLAARPGAVYDPRCDLDGDRKVDAYDVGLAQLWLFLPPGPSGKRPLSANGKPR